MQIAFTCLRKLTDNGHINSFNGKSQDDSLNQNIFLFQYDALRTIETRRQDITVQHIGLADIGRILRKKYNLYPIGTHKLASGIRSG